MPQRRISGQNSHSRNNRQQPASSGAGRSGARSSFGRPAGRPSGRPGSGRPGSGRPSSGRPGSGRSGSSRPSSGRPSFGRPSSGRPSRGAYGSSSSRSSDFSRSDSDNSERGERRSFDRPDRSERGERRSFDRPERSERGERRSFDRPDRAERGERRSFDRPDRPPRSGAGRPAKKGRPLPHFESQEERDKWFKDREDYKFFHNISKRKPFDPANPSGVDDDDEVRRPERLPEPDVYESTKSQEEPRGKRLITGFSANDDKVRRARKPLKRVLSDKSAQGRLEHKQRMASEGDSQPASDRPLPQMKHRAKAEKRAPRSPKAKKSDSDESSGIRLQKALAAAGLGSRRACEELIAAGRVEIDGKVVSELGVCVQPGQKIRVDGENINQGKRHYFMLNKPEKFICTNADPDGRARAVDLIDERVPGLFPVGRLDMSSTGLLLITNDGELANRLTHPSYEVQKIYRVHVSGVPSQDVIKKMCEGIYIAEGKVHADSAKVKQVYKNGTATIEMALSEGKNREIRRILARLGHNVLGLTRIAVGPVKLGKLPTGAYRRLTTAEVRQLKELVSMR